MKTNKNIKQTKGNFLKLCMVGLLSTLLLCLVVVSISGFTQTVSASSQSVSTQFMQVSPQADTITLDMSGIKFENATFSYNGSTHTIVLSGALPPEVQVTYSGGNQKEVGEYTVTATFSVDEDLYNSIAPMTAKLTIQEAEDNILPIIITCVVLGVFVVLVVFINVILGMRRRKKLYHYE